MEAKLSNVSRIVEPASSSAASWIEMSRAEVR